MKLQESWQRLEICCMKGMTLTCGKSKTYLEKIGVVKMMVELLHLLKACLCEDFP